MWYSPAPVDSKRTVGAWLDPGSTILHDQRSRGTDAYGARALSFFIIEWDPLIWGPSAPSQFSHDVIPRADVARLAAAVARLRDLSPGPAALAVIELLRVLGMPFPRVSVGDLDSPASHPDQAMLDVLSERLSAIDDKPSIDEVSARLCLSSRQVNRRYGAMARAHGIPWTHWRALLHSTRMLTALRILASGNATTEFAAQRAGFRSPGALCHALADAGLPSPGRLVRAARSEVLERWTEFTQPRQLLTG